MIIIIIDMQSTQTRHPAVSDFLQDLHPYVPNADEDPEIEVSIAYGDKSIPALKKCLDVADDVFDVRRIVRFIRHEMHSMRNRHIACEIELLSDLLSLFVDFDDEIIRQDASEACNKILMEREGCAQLISDPFLASILVNVATTDVNPVVRRQCATSLSYATRWAHFNSVLVKQHEGVLAPLIRGVGNCLSPWSVNPLASLSQAKPEDTKVLRSYGALDAVAACYGYLKTSPKDIDPNSLIQLLVDCVMCLVYLTESDEGKYEALMDSENPDGTAHALLRVGVSALTLHPEHQGLVLSALTLLCSLTTHFTGKKMLIDVHRNSLQTLEALLRSDNPSLYYSCSTLLTTLMQYDLIADDILRMLIRYQTRHFAFPLPEDAHSGTVDRQEATASASGTKGGITPEVQYRILSRKSLVRLLSYVSKADSQADSQEDLVQAMRLLWTLSHVPAALTSLCNTTPAPIPVLLPLAYATYEGSHAATDGGSNPARGPLKEYTFPLPPHVRLYSTDAAPENIFQTMHRQLYQLQETKPEQGVEQADAQTAEGMEGGAETGAKISEDGAEKQTQMLSKPATLLYRAISKQARTISTQVAKLSQRLLFVLLNQQPADMMHLEELAKALGLEHPPAWYNELQQESETTGLSN